MSIRIEDLNTMDFSDVVDSTANDLPPIHPGEILREDFLAPLGLSVNALALALHLAGLLLAGMIRDPTPPSLVPPRATRVSVHLKAVPQQAPEVTARVSIAANSSSVTCHRRRWWRR